MDDLGEKPSVWLQAPPGAGKTTLLSSYLEQNGGSNLWFQVDERDADLASFFHHLGLAVEAVTPDQPPMPNLTAEFALGLPAFTTNFFEQVAHRLPHPITITLDNYQLLPEETPIHSLLAAVVEGFSGLITLYFASREKPPAAFARLRANSYMALLDMDDLRLTEKEVRAVLKARGVKQAKEYATQLHELTSGWAAGVSLVVEQGGKPALEPGKLSNSTQQALFDYFAYEIFYKLAPEIQESLLLSSFLPRMVESVVVKLAGKDAIDILHQMNSANYFIDLRENRGETEYEFHALFRQFLQEQAGKTFSLEKKREIQKSAALLLQENGSTEDAMDLLLDSESWEEAAMVIVTNTQSYISQGRYALLADWFSRIPKPVIESNPWLLACYAKQLQPINPDESLKAFEKSYFAFKSVGERSGMFLSWCGICETIFHGFNDFRPYEKWVNEMESVLQEDSSFPSEQIELMVGVSFLTACTYSNSSRRMMDQWVTRLDQLSLDEADKNYRILACYFLALWKIWLGQFPEAQVILDRVKQWRRQDTISPLLELMCLMNDACFASLVGYVDESIELVEKAVRLADKSGVQILTPLLYQHAATAAISDDRLELSGEYLHKAEKAFRLKRSLDEYLQLYWTSVKGLAEGNFVAYIPMLNSTKDLVKERNTAFGQELINLLLAEMYLELGDFEKSKESILLVDESNSVIGSDYVNIVARMVETRLALALGNKEKALEQLSLMMSIGSKRQIYNTFMWRRPVISDLCALALENDIEPAYVTTLVKRRNLRPSNPPLLTQNWPWPVKIRTLGCFEVLVDSKPVSFVGKSQKKPMELLKVLISLGGVNVPVVKITDLLWPDSEGDSAYNTFSSTLHRLRKLFGSAEDALLLSDGKLSFDDRVCWLDIWAFDKIQSRMSRAKNSNVDGLIKYAHAISEIYKGAYLPGDDSFSWTSSLRGRLRLQLIRTLVNIVNQLREANKFSEVEAICLGGLKVEPMSKELYSVLMESYQESKNSSAALSLYEQYLASYVRPAGGKPLAEVEDSYRSIQKMASL